MSQLLTSHVSDGNGSGHVNRLDALEAKAFDLGGEVAEFRQAFDAEKPFADFALMTFPVHVNPFRPAGPREIPDSIVRNVSHKLARIVALEMNAEALTPDGKARWCFLVPAPTHGKYSVVRVRCAKSRLPDSPDSYDLRSADIFIEPQGARKDTAITEADANNADMMRLAGQPPMWSLAVRSLKDAPESGCSDVK